MATLSSSIPQALLVDWGGVLTVPFSTALRSWSLDEGLDSDQVLATLSALIGGSEGTPLHELEVGAATREQVAPWLAELLSPPGSAVDPSGLFDRMFSSLHTRPEAVQFVRNLRTRGVCTVLVSNSWGDSYDRTGWDSAFDHVVISGEIGLRKPTPEIFAHACTLAGVLPRDAVFVDDEPSNIAAAEAFGLRAVRVAADDPLGIEGIAALWA